MQTIGVGRRAAAVIVDSILLFVVAYVVAMATGGTTEEGFKMNGAPVFAVFLIAIVYYVAMEATMGATLGKKAVGIKVVKSDGSPMDWQSSIVRNVLRIIDGFFGYLLGAIVIWTSKNRQRLGDMAAHTLVVSAKG